MVLFSKTANVFFFPPGKCYYFIERSSSLHAFPKLNRILNHSLCSLSHIHIHTFSLLFPYFRIGILYKFQVFFVSFCFQSKNNFKCLANQNKCLPPSTVGVCECLMTVLLIHKSYAICWCTIIFRCTTRLGLSLPHVLDWVCRFLICWKPICGRSLLSGHWP